MSSKDTPPIAECVLTPTAPCAEWEFINERPIVKKNGFEKNVIVDTCRILFHKKNKKVVSAAATFAAGVAFAYVSGGGLVFIPVVINGSSKHIEK